MTLFRTVALAAAGTALALLAPVLEAQAQSPDARRQFQMQRRQAGQVTEETGQGQLYRRCMMAMRRSGHTVAPAGRNSGMTGLRAVDECVASGGPPASDGAAEPGGRRGHGQRMRGAGGAMPPR